MLISIAVWGVLVPGASAAALMLLALRPWARAPEADGGAADTTQHAGWAAGLALAAGYLGGHLGLPGAPGPGSADVGRFALYFAVLGGIAGIVFTRWSMPAVVRWLVKLTLGALYAWFLLRPRVEGGLGVGTAVAAGVAITLAIAATWWIVQRRAAAEPGPALVMALVFWGSGGSATLVMSGTALVGQLSGVLLAALGGLLVVLLRWPAVGRLRSAAGVVALTLVGHWAYALLYASMSWPAFALLALGATVLLIVELPLLRSRGPAVRLLVRLAALTLITTVAAGWTARIYFEGASQGEAASETSTEGVPVDMEGQDDDYGY